MFKTIFTISIALFSTIVIIFDIINDKKTKQIKEENKRLKEELRQYKENEIELTKIEKQSR